MFGSRRAESRASQCTLYHRFRLKEFFVFITLGVCSSDSWQAIEQVSDPTVGRSQPNDSAKRMHGMWCLECGVLSSRNLFLLVHDMSRMSLGDVFTAGKH